ncbi:MAG: response regulator [Deltaproteobacteria bacterium]|jgi:CheY-like chemotaxis protein|nr:response regulator [Deltaproteobacteria bacterium]
MKQKEIEILLVEDNPVDIEITKRAFEKGKLKNNLHVVRDGEEALDFLYRKGQYADESKAPRPDLILLDINLPRIGGIDVLKTLKADPNLKRIPVTMLTVSDKDEDILRSFEMGVNSYITKPVDFNKFVEAIKAHHFYWTVITELPPK